jgi:hypothetical protein
MEGGSPLGTFLAEALIVLVFGVILVLTLRTMFMVSMLTWAPLAALWRRLTGRAAPDYDTEADPPSSDPPAP